MQKKFNLIGQRFGRLVVRTERGRRLGAILWLCDCDCGNESLVTGCHLRQVPSGTRSCGCQKLENAARMRSYRQLQHGHARRGKMTSTYSRWAAMISRCEDSSHKAFKNYGGRGIKVCKRWRKSFAAFLVDMGEPPEGLMLDRRNNNGNYTPDNCRWVTRRVSNKNQRGRIEGSNT